MTNSDLKRAVRARMAETGENYTTALRRIREERVSLNPPHGEARWPAATGDAIELRSSAGWVMWDGIPDGTDHPEGHSHVAPDTRRFGHRHQGGERPHDHMPAANA